MADNKVDGQNTGEIMNPGYTDADGDSINNASNTILGNAGNDTINAGGGDDLVYGDNGASTSAGGTSGISGGFGNLDSEQRIDGNLYGRFSGYEKNDTFNFTTDAFYLGDDIVPLTDQDNHALNGQVFTQDGSGNSRVTELVDINFTGAEKSFVGLTTVQQTSIHNAVDQFSASNGDGFEDVAIVNSSTVTFEMNDGAIYRHIQMEVMRGADGRTYLIADDHPSRGVFNSIRTDVFKNTSGIKSFQIQDISDPEAGINPIVGNWAAGQFLEVLDPIEDEGRDDIINGGAGDDVIIGDNGSIELTSYFVDLSNFSDHHSHTAASGNDSIGLSIDTPLNGAGEGWSVSNGLLRAINVEEPTSANINFEEAVCNLAFTLRDVDALDEVRIIALDASGNEVPVTFENTGVHAINGNTVTGTQTNSPGVVDNNNAQDINVQIAGPIASVEFVLDNGPERSYSGEVAVDWIKFDVAPLGTDSSLLTGDDIINGGTGDDVIYGDNSGVATYTAHTLDLGHFSNNNNHTINNGADPVGVSITNPLNDEGRGWTVSNGLLRAINVTEPTTANLDFDTPVSSVAFTLRDVDALDEVRIIALDENGNEVPVTFENTGVHAINGNTVVGTQTNSPGVVDNNNAQDINVQIAGPIASLAFVLDNGPERSYSGEVAVDAITFNTLAPTTDGKFGGDSGIGGDDIITGNEGADTMYGQGGNDTFIVGSETDGAGDVIVGGNGPDQNTDYDVLDLRGAGPVTIDDADDVNDVDARAGTVTFENGSTLEFSQIEEILQDAPPTKITITPGPGTQIDDEGRPVTLENGAPAQIVVSLDAPALEDTVITLTDVDPSETDAPTTVTIPAGQTSVVVDVPSVDDPVVDGTQIAPITATAPGLTPDTIDVAVQDDDVPTLTIEAAPGTPVDDNGNPVTAEKGDPVELVVTRTGPTDEPLVVTLNSDDTTEGTVPQRVTIPAGQDSIIVPVTPVDDPIVDGDQTPIITATAPGFDPVEQPVVVADDDEPTLTIEPAPGTPVDDNGIPVTQENGEPVELVVTRTGPTDEPLEVTLGSDDTTEGTVPQTVTIPAGQDSVTVAVTPIDDPDVDGDQTPIITATAPGFDPVEQPVVVEDDDAPETPVLTITPADDTPTDNNGNPVTQENGEPVDVVITRTGPTDEPLEVTLGSDDTTEGTVPQTVTIPAGQDSVTVAVTPVDDPIVDGDQTPIITATAPGFDPVEQPVVVKDDDGNQGPDAVDDDIAASPVDTPVVISPAELLSNDSDPEGDAFTPVSIQDPENGTVEFDGTNVIFTPDAGYEGPASFTYTIQENDTGKQDTATVNLVIGEPLPTLTIEPAPDTPVDDNGNPVTQENGEPVDVVITRTGPLDEPLEVTLGSDDPTEGTVPQTVTIPAGQDSVTVAVTPVDDPIVDGDQTPIITATAPGFDPVEQPVVVEDDDAPETPVLTITPADDTPVDDDGNPVTQENGEPVDVVITRTGPTDEPLEVTLGSDDPTEGTVPQTVTIPAGQDSVTVSVTPVDDPIVDGDQTPIITATAPGFDPVEQPVVVKDDDGNQGPDAVDDDIAASPVDTPVVISPAELLSNDSDPEGDAFTPVSIQDPENGTVEFDGTNVIFTPDAGYEGPASFTYTIQENDTGKQDTATVNLVIGEPRPTLTIEPAPDTPVDDNGNPVTQENGEPVDVVITRTGPLDEPLEVTLGSDDPTEGTVPQTVTIPAGQDSVTVAVTPVDDPIVDGDQTPIITATAPGFDPVEQPVVVEDDDAPETPVLTITPADDTPVDDDGNPVTQENGEPVDVVITRTGPTDEPLEVTLGSDDPTEGTVPQTVTIPAGQDSVTVSVTPVDDPIVDGDQTPIITATAPGFDPVEQPVVVEDDDTVAGNQGPDAVDDDIAASPVDTPVVISPAELLGNDSDPEGDAFSGVSIQDPVNGSVTFDGTNVIFTPTPGYNGPASFTYTIEEAGTGKQDTATVNLTIGNNEPVLTIKPADNTPVDNNGNPVTQENGEPVDVVITRTGPLDQPLEVTLGSDDTTEGTVPQTVTIPAGEDSVTVAVTPVDDPIVDGDQTPIITATAPGFDPIEQPVVVEDDDTVAGNQGPDAVDDDIAASPVDTPVVISPAELLGNDSDPEGDAFSGVSIQDPVNGSVTFDGTNVIFTPTPGYNGPASFTYTIEEAGTGKQDTATVNLTIGNNEPVLTIKPADNTPVDNNGNPVTQENGEPVDVVITRTGSLDEPLEVTLGSDDPTEGTVPQTVTIPAGQDSVTVAVTPVDDPDVDGDQTTNITATAPGFDPVEQTVVVEDDDTVAGNQGPDAVDDDIAASPVGTPVVISPSELLDNDSDPEGDAFNGVSVQDPVNGSVTFDGTNVIFTPTPGYNGSASFTYTIEEAGTGKQDTATVNLTIGNNEPVLTIKPADNTPVDDNGNPVTQENGEPVDVVITRTGSLDEPLEVTLGSDDPTEGTVPQTVTIPAGQDSVTVAVTPVDDPDVDGDQTTNITATAPGFDPVEQTVVVEDDDVVQNELPVANPDTINGVENTPIKTTVAELLSNDTDPDGDTPALVTVQNAQNGSVALDPNGVVYFIPDTDFIGEAKYDYTITDGNGGESTTTVTVNVTAQNIDPVAKGDSANTIEGEPVVTPVAELLANDTDADGDTLSVVSVQDPENGQVSLDPSTGLVTFTPDAGFIGDASYVYTISDGKGGFDSATVHVCIVAANEGPVATDDTIAPSVAGEEVVISIAELLSNDFDPDGDAVHPVALVGTPENGTVRVEGGYVIFTPTPGYDGPAAFDYQITDNNGGFDTATVNLDILKANIGPVAGNDTAEGTQDSPVLTSIAALLVNDTDADGGQLTITSVQNAQNGSVALDTDNGTVVFIPAEGYKGPASYTYTVSDGQGGVATATVNLNIAELNEAPVANDDLVPGATKAGEPLVIATSDVLDNDNDPNQPNDVLTVTEVGSPVNGTVTLNGTNITFTPNAGHCGPASFTYVVTDTDGLTSTATVNLVVGDTLQVGDDQINELFGTAGSDVMNGLGANDRLLGLDGDDCLHGGEGTDWIEGGAGNDVIEGGRGSDFLDGGNANLTALTSGADTFVWKFDDILDEGNGREIDYVKNFGSDDVLDISDLLQDEQNAVGNNANQILDEGYLNFEYDASAAGGIGGTVISVSAFGSFNLNEVEQNGDQQIVLEGLDLTAGNTISDADIITKLLNNNQLNTDIV